jgi:DNA invertase Pin-like site-specific DNA recombinase
MAMMKPDQKTVALVYIRQSVTDPKDENNYSPRTQRAAALARPEITGMRHEVYEDLDLSGGSVVGRDAYQKMSDRLDDGDVGFLVCYDLGRLARDLGDQQALFKVAERYGVKVIDALKNIVFDPGKASDKFIANVFGSMNEFQRDEIGEKISGALATKAKGGDLVGPVPCGYIRRHTTNEASGKVIKTWVEILQSAAEVIRIIFRDYATGAFSFKSLARSLNTRGIQPHSGTTSAVGTDRLAARSTRPSSPPTPSRTCSATRAMRVVCRCAMAARSKERSRPSSTWRRSKSASASVSRNDSKARPSPVRRTLARRTC